MPSPDRAKINLPRPDSRTINLSLSPPQPNLPFPQHILLEPQPDGQIRASIPVLREIYDDCSAYTLKPIP